MGVAPFYTKQAIYKIFAFQASNIELSDFGGPNIQGRTASTWEPSHDFIKLEPRQSVLRLSLGQFGFLMVLNQQVRKAVALVIQVVNHSYKKEVGLLLHNWSQEDYPATCPLSISAS